MTIKVNGGIQPGVWVERNVEFVKLTFSADITTSAFDIPNSCLDNAIAKLLENKATVLAVSELSDDGLTVDVMLGHAQGYTSATDNAVISTGTTVDGVDEDGVAVAATVAIKFAVFSGLRAAVAGDLTLFEGQYFRSI